MKNIASALLKAQRAMGNAKKGSLNPFLRNKYADLNSIREAVIPILNECGIVVLQPLVHEDGKNYVRTMLLHSESGELVEGLTEIVYRCADDPQAYGGGITYARRYGLQSIMCIGAEDDDGETAQGRDKAKQPAAQSPAPVQGPAPQQRPAPMQRPAKKRLNDGQVEQLAEDVRKVGAAVFDKYKNAYSLTESQLCTLNNAMADYKINNNIK